MKEETKVVRSDNRTASLERYAEILEEKHGPTVESGRLKKQAKNIAALNESDRENHPMVYSYMNAINLRDLDESQNKIVEAQTNLSKEDDDFSLSDIGSVINELIETEGPLGLADRYREKESLASKKDSLKKTASKKETKADLKARLLKEAERRGISKL